MPSIYHITHLQNLPSIIEHGGLLCDYAMVERGLSHQGIAHQEIKIRRAEQQVPVAKGGSLANYVPFYFAPRSPMLYSIHTGSVQSYNGGQEFVLHLVTSTQQIVHREISFCFTDGHAIMAFSHFYDDLADLDQIDWGIMKAIYWSNTSDDPDRKRRRQAEFLVHNFVPWDLVSEIGVMTTRVAQAVEPLLSSVAHRPVVRIHQDWYY